MSISGYGVCRLAIVSVRKDPIETGEQVTQLLFGDHYEVTSQTKDRNWFRISIYADGCEGWIPALQHHEISPEYFNQINDSNYKIVTDVTASILYNKSPIAILIGSIVPISNSELFRMEEHFAFNGESKSLGQRREYEFLKSVAMKYQNAPYQPGGKSPFGIDDSALVQMVYRIAGYNLPRNLKDQMSGAIPVEDYSVLKPGDLAFFSDMQTKALHPGIILDGEKVMHVSGRVRLDHLMEEGILNLETKIITHTIDSMRQVLPHQ